MKKEKKVSHVRVCSLFPDIYMYVRSSLWRCAAVRRSPRKMEKKPIYVINVSIALEDVDNYIDPTKSVVHLRVSTSSDTLICARKLNVIGQNKTSLVSFLSSVLECFLIKNGFSLPKEGPTSGSPPSPQKRRKLERYKFDDSGYAEPSIGEMPLEDQHHMVPDLSTTFYTTPVSFHILSWPDMWF
jgi:hypothetical protein